MKKPTVDYTDEPPAKGWKFDPAAKPLSPAALARLGIPASSPDTVFEKSETKGRVTVAPAAHGGKRSGAGRKPSGNVRLQLSVPAEIRAKLGKLAARERITLSEAFSRVVSAA